MGGRLWPVRRRRCWSVFSMWWGGGQPAVGVAGQPPAALMDRPMVGSAQQGQVGQVGGAAVEPVAQMVGLAPGRGPVAAGHRTAAVADDQGGALGGGDDPAGPADLQRLGGGAPKGRGEPGRRRLEPGRQAGLVAGSWATGGRRRGSGGWWWRVTSTRVTAPSQASRRQVSGSSGQGPPVSPPSPPGPRRLSRSTVTSSWGRTPPVWGSWPALQGAAGQLGQGIGAALATAAVVVGAGWGGPGAPGRPAGSGRPRGPTAR